MVNRSSRAEEALSRVLAQVGSLDREWAIEVEAAWTEADDVLCLVYRQPGMYGNVTLGLRRTVEADWTIDGVVEEILVGELSEPLGSLYDTLQPDADGVMWWTGNLPEWKERH